MGGAVSPPSGAGRTRHLKMPDPVARQGFIVSVHPILIFSYPALFTAGPRGHCPARHLVRSLGVFAVSVMSFLPRCRTGSPCLVCNRGAEPFEIPQRFNISPMAFTWITRTAVSNPTPSRDPSCLPSVPPCWQYPTPATQLRNDLRSLAEVPCWYPPGTHCRHRCANDWHPPRAKRLDRIGWPASFSTVALLRGCLSRIDHVPIIALHLKALCFGSADSFSGPAIFYGPFRAYGRLLYRRLCDRGS